ncbi:MAG: hypothetical protein IJ662_07620 [Clostridia bacterium]|nr:hypothetical protein [Clostridia bacterium]
MSELKFYDPLGPSFLRVGRYDPRDSLYGLWWSGSGLVMQIACTQLEIEVESTARDHAQWLGVMIDGEGVARFPLRQGVHRYLALAGMESGVSHEVTILRDTQPSYDEAGPLWVHGVYTDGTIEKPADKKLLVEFLGDSLTVGEGTLGPVSAQEWRMPFISHLPAFPTLAAAALNAEKRVIALGGWGAYKSWDGKHDCRIGAIYEQLCAVTPGGDRPYAFSERPADAVVINLGTNDASALKKEGAEPFEQETEHLIADAVDLLRLVRRHQPAAHIFWAYGLCGIDMTPYLERAVQQYRQETGDQRVSFLPLPDAAGDVGSRSHPSRAAHRKAARAIVDAIEHMEKE